MFQNDIPISNSMVITIQPLQKELTTVCQPKPKGNIEYFHVAFLCCSLRLESESRALIKCISVTFFSVLVDTRYVLHYLRPVGSEGTMATPYFDRSLSQPGWLHYPSKLLLPPPSRFSELPTVLYFFASCDNFYCLLNVYGNCPVAHIINIRNNG